MAITYDEAKGGYTEESTTLKPNSNGTISVDEASYVASVNDIHKGTSIVNSANDTSALAETIDNSTTIYVTGTGAYTPNVNLTNEGKIVFGKKDATFDGTYAGTINGLASNLATVQVLNGSLTLESGATIDLIGNFKKNRGFILGTVDAAEDDGTMKAVVTVKEGATLNARNYFWIGSAYGSYETPEEQSERFKLIIDGGKVDATSNAFTLRNTGAMEILNGGSFSAHDGSVRNYISVTGEGSNLEYGGNVYGEAPSGAEGALTYGTASITVSDGATANFTNLAIGGEGASRENRRGSVIISNATATAKTILLSQANDGEEIRAELSLENSSLTAETITNYGAVNVTGASTLDAEFMAAGTGLLNLNSVAFGSGTSVNDTASYTNNTIGSEIVMTGTNTLTDGAFVSTGWSKNFRLGYETGTESDSLEISGGATLKVGGNSYIGSNPEDKRAGAYQVTVSGAGSSFAGSGAGGDLYLRRDGQLTVKDDASASFSYADIKGSVILENGNFSFIDSRLIGTITMDYASTLTFSGEINSAGGAITVDMTNFSGGVYKLIDCTGSASYTLDQYKALIGEENWNKNFTVVDNDLYAVNVDTSTLKVNAAWSGTAIGTEVAEGFYYGFNAFGDMNTAVSSIDRSYVLGDTFGVPITIEMTDATSGTLNLYGMNLVLTGNLTSSGSWNLALTANSSSDPNYITYLKLDNARIEMTGNAALEGVNWGNAAVSFDKDGNIIASDGQDIQRGAIVELVNGTVFDADNQINGRGVFFKIDGTSKIYQYGSGNSLISMTSGAIIDGGVAEAGTYNGLNQLDARWIYFGKGSGEWAGIYGDKTYFTFRKGANVEAVDRIEFGTGSLLKEMDVEIDASRIVATNNMIIGTEDNAAGKITSFVVSNNSLLQAGTDLSIVGTTVNLINSTLNADTVTLTDGKLNVSGTSAITAAVGGAIDIVDGADVTFGAGSTSDDLRIASGAEVTLQGSLSSGNIYGVDEEGTHEYNDGSDGITVNVVTGDGETFKSYAWYASNGSTYNVQSGSSAEITYANINATGTINVAEGATLTTVMESSNIVGTLNVDGTANGVMTVYAGYTGGQFTNGAQAGEVNINGTGTVNTSIMTIGTAVRDDDKYNAAAVEGSNTTASVVVDGGTLNATGFEGELTSKLFVGSDDSEGVLTGKNGAKINVGERSENGTGYMRFLIGEKGALNLDNSTMTVYNLGGTNNSVNGIFENSGTISMDLASQIITATVLNNNYGTITVDMSDATEFGVYKLVDYTGTSEVTGYGNVTLCNSAYETVVIDGDLFAANVDMSTLKVNAAWSTLDIGEQVADGFYYGFNAFDNLDKVYSTIAAGGVSQIELQSNVQLENGNPPISDMWFKFQDDVTIDSDVAGETRTITLSGHELLLTSMDQSRGNGGQQISITLGKDINILTDSAIWFGYCYNNADAYPQYAGNFATDITLNGSITMTSGQAHIFGHGSTMTITETGSLTVAGSDIQTRGSHLIVNGSGKEMAQAQVQLNHENIEGDSPLVITGDDFVDSPAAASWTLNNTFVNINTFLDRVVNS